MSNTRATCWSVTINNPIQADEDNIAKARQNGWKVEGQLEKGKEGTPHYQLCVKTPQVRFSALKKQFPRAHIEVARNKGALEQYVVKEDTREGELQVKQDKYPSREKVFDLFTEWINCNYGHAFENPISKWDFFIREMIMLGYYVEGIGMDPQTRSIVKYYGSAILIRSSKKLEEVHRQTDRQTDENNLRGQVITENEGSDNESVVSEAFSSSSSSSSYVG